MREGAYALAAVTLLASLAGVAGQPAGFDASYSRIEGTADEMSVRIRAAPGHTIALAETQRFGGEWLAMQREIGHTFVTGHSFVFGDVLRFRATSSEGQVDVSDCYVWSGSEGTESACPAPAWHGDIVATIPGDIYDLAWGDADGLGGVEMYVAASPGLYQVHGGATTAVDDSAAWGDVIVSDLDGDGKRELYATRHTMQPPLSELHRLEWTDQGWSDTLTYVTERGFHNLLASELDSNGIALYAVEGDGRIVQLRGAGFLVKTTVYEYGTGLDWVSIDTLQVAEADGDPGPELVVNVFGTRDHFPVQEAHVLEAVGPTWTSTRAAYSPYEVRCMLGGHLDGLPGPEVMLLDRYGGLWKYEWTGLRWVETLAGKGPYGSLNCTAGDLDGDGAREIHFTTIDTESWAITFNGSSPSFHLLADTAGIPQGEPVVANQDGMGPPELYQARAEPAGGPDTIARLRWGF